MAEILCPPLQTPANGRKSTENVTADSVVYFSCDNGYDVDGQAVLTCQFGESLNGTWNGTEPVCSGRHDPTQDVMPFFYFYCCRSLCRSRRALQGFKIKDGGCLDNKYKSTYQSGWIFTSLDWESGLLPWRREFSAIAAKSWQWKCTFLWHFYGLPFVLIERLDAALSCSRTKPFHCANSPGKLNIQQTQCISKINTAMCNEFEIGALVSVTMATVL